MVELTEHRRVADYPTLVAAVAELRLRDAKLAVDDAGAGYAGLHHLMVLRDRGHYVGVLRIEQLVHHILTGAGR